MTNFEWQRIEQLLGEIWHGFTIPDANRQRYYAIFQAWTFDDLKWAVERYFGANPDTRGPHFKDIMAMRRAPQAGTDTDDHETVADWQRTLDEEAGRFRHRWTGLSKEDREAVLAWTMERMPEKAREAVGDGRDPLKSNILRAFASLGMRVVLDGEPDVRLCLGRRQWELEKWQSERALKSIATLGGAVKARAAPGGWHPGR